MCLHLAVMFPGTSNSSSVDPDNDDDGGRFHVKLGEIRVSHSLPMEQFACRSKRLPSTRHLPLALVRVC